MVPIHSFTGYAGTFSGPTRRAASYLLLGVPVSSTFGGSTRLGLVASTDLASASSLLVVLDAVTSSSWLLP